MPSPSSPQARKAAPSSKLGLPSCSGPIWYRVARLHALINQQQRVSAVSLASELEMNERTIRRTVRLMRDDLGMPIEWCFKTRSYRFTAPCPFLPLMCVEADESTVLKLMRLTLPGRADARFAEALQNVLTKFSLVVGGTNSFATGTAHHVPPPSDGLAAAELEHVITISEAKEERRELRIAYRKSGAAQPKTHTVHPLELAFIDQRWMMLARDVAAQAVHTFLLGRIVSAERTGEQFEPPADFDAAARLRGNIGCYTGNEDHEVRIALSDFAAVQAREFPWHVSQKTRKRSDGRTEIVLRLNNLVDIEHFILRWGAQAEVLAPAKLRTQVQATLTRAMGLYA